MRLSALKSKVSVLALVLAAVPGVAHARAAVGDQAQGDTAGADDAQAAADEIAGPTEVGDPGESIVVTGSRIARPETSLPNPVQSFTSENIEQSGETNITDFLTDTPALQGSSGSELNAGSNAGYQAAGLNLLNLRNLGTERTLVLVNGRRHVNAYPGESSVDINTMPIDLIERIDILTGGASAIYGADGVSGVVNFIMKRDFHGVSARGQIGISEEGDAGNRYASIVAGQNFAGDRGNVALAYEFNDSDRLSQRKRSYTGSPQGRFELQRNPDDFPDDPNVYDRILMNGLSWADSSPSGAVDVDLDFAPDFEGNGRVYDPGEFLSGTGGRARNSSSNTPTAGYFGDFLPAIRRHNVNLLTSFEVHPALRLFGEGKYVATTAFTEAQPSFDFYTYLTPDNAFLQQRFGGLAPDGAYVNRDNFDLGISADRAERETVRTVLGADGRFTRGEGSGNLRYEASYVYGRSKSVVTGFNNRVTDRYYAALDAVVNPATGQVTCRINLPGETTIDANNYAGIAPLGTGVASGLPLTFQRGQCVPLNILGEGVATQEAIDFVMVDTTTRAKSEQHVASAFLAGDLGFLFSLPGGPAGFAVGAEYRKESTRSQPDPIQALGGFDGGAQILESGGDFDVKEVYGELNVPILADLPFAHLLSVGGAVRLSDYSTIGTTTTWRVDGTFAPIQDITFRGTYSQAVRAPNITELFSPQQGTFQFLDDPCDPTNIQEGSSSRAANCLATLQGLGLTPAQIAAFSPATDPEQSTSQPGLRGGNPNLKEETARTWTAGIVLRPRFLPGFSASVDWYDIKLRDAINTATADEILALCVDQPTLENVFCESVGRDPATGFVNRYVVGPQNVANFNTSGADFTVNYRLRPSERLGTFNLRVVGGYLNKLTFIPSVGAEEDEDVGERRAARWVVSGDLTWTQGPVTLNYGLNWNSKTRRFTTEQLRANPDISDPRFFWYKERWEHDFRASFNVDERFSFFGGVNNFTDQKPDIAALEGYPVSPVGRYFFFGARARFGAN